MTVSPPTSYLTQCAAEGVHCNCVEVCKYYPRAMTDIQAVTSPHIQALYRLEGQNYDDQLIVIAFARPHPNVAPKACVFDSTGVLVFADSLPGFTRLAG